MNCNSNLQQNDDYNIPPLGLYTVYNTTANQKDVKEEEDSSGLALRLTADDHKPVNKRQAGGNSNSSSSSRHRKQYNRSSESFESEDDDELGTSFAHDAHDGDKTMNASAPIIISSSMDRDSSSRSASPMSKSSSRHTRRRGIMGGSITTGGVPTSPNNSRRGGRLQRKSSSAAGVGYRRSATVPREGGTGSTIRTSSAPSSPKMTTRATHRNTPVSPEEIKAIRDTANEMIERVAQRERENQQKIMMMSPTSTHSDKGGSSTTTKRDSEGSTNKKKNDRTPASPRNSPTARPVGLLQSNEKSNLGFSARTLGQMFDNVIEDDDDWELGGIGSSYPIPPTLESRQKEKTKKNKGGGGLFSSNPLRFPRKTNNCSDDSTGSASSFSLFKSAIFGGGIGGGFNSGSRDTIYEESVSFTDEQDTTTNNTKKLGSTILAERGEERFAAIAVDQSINLMDASGGNYFHTPDNPNNPNNNNKNNDLQLADHQQYRRGVGVGVGSGSSGSPSLSVVPGTRESRRRRDNKRRGTIFDLMFGRRGSATEESSSSSPERESIPRIPRGRSQKKKVRKTSSSSSRKSMVDVVLGGGDPRRSPSRYFAELEKEEKERDESSCWGKWKKRIASGCLALFIVAHLIMAILFLYWVFRSSNGSNGRSSNDSNDKKDSSSLLRSPSHSPTPTTASPSIQPVGTSVLKENSELANSRVSKETIRSAPNQPVNHTKPVIEAMGITASTTASSSVSLDAAKSVSLAGSLGDEGGASNDDDNNNDFWNNDTLTHFESIVLRFNLTSQDDLRNPQSDAHAALQWMSQFQEDGGRQTIEVDDTDEPQQQPSEDSDWKEHQQAIEKYVLAVFHFATHPYGDNRRILKASPANTALHHYHTSSSSSSLRAPEARPPLKKSHPAGIPGLKHLREGFEGTAWMKDDSVCDWRGIRCKDGFVTHVKLTEFALHGTIPSEIFGLKDLLELDLSRNHIHGTIPSTVARLTRLTYLDLKKNKLKGTLSEKLGKLTALHGINLEMNTLEGTIPPSLLQDKTHLKSIVLSSNQFEGSIPPLVDLPNLLDLDLSANSLQGTLPPIGNLAKLTNLKLHDNHVSGSIPPSWSQLTRLESLILHHNDRISGTLPDFLSSMYKLKDIRLNHNALTGPIPDMGELMHLKHLHLNTNQFSGSLPSVALDNLETLLLFQNNIVGNAEIICESDDVYNHLQRFAADCKSSVSCECCDECF